MQDDKSKPRRKRAGPAEIVSISAAAFDRILANIGQEFIPAALDKIGLQRAIEMAIEISDDVDRFRPGPRSKATIASAKLIREDIDNLLVRLKKNKDAYELITQWAPSISEDLKRWKMVTSVIEETADLNAETKKRYPRVPSPREWLAGVELPLVFEEFFGRPAGRSRSTRKAGGPTVRFVTSIMTETGMPFPEESVVRAMTRFANLRSGRRTVRNNSGPAVGQK